MRVVLEVLREHKTLREVAKQFEVHPVQINKWKRELLTRASAIFNSGRKADDFKQKEACLHEQIGKLSVENHWLKKIRNFNLEEKRRFIEPKNSVLSRKQSESF